MKQGKGLSVCDGVALGSAFVYRNAVGAVQQEVGTPAEEQKKFETAIATAAQQLQILFEQLKQQLGEEKAAILEVQLLMLKDLDFLEGVAEQIKAGENASTAVRTTGKTMAEFFSSLDDPYMKERATDVLDVSRRVENILLNSQPPAFPKGEFIVVAEDLAPSETVTFPRERILAFVTQKGSASSHTAILARTLNIPSLVQADISLDDIAENTVLGVDGSHGRWYADPTKEVVDLLQEHLEKDRLQKESLSRYRGKKTFNHKGKEVLLCANIGSLLDLPAVQKGDAQGIGLMRSEFLYLGRTQPPSEEEQLEVYRQVAQTMGEKIVVIRTLDIGADKQVPYISTEQEENPALGLRGLRLCFAYPEIFKTQLRAIYRASPHGNLHIMFPMVSSLWEIRKAKAICESVRNRLVTQGYGIKPVPIGIMIETPAAALISPILAREVDFFSVGTNDLIQYTLAVDRQNAALEPYCDANHPALLKLLSYVGENARRAGIWAGVCGELGADPNLVPQLIRMGYTEISMTPGKILQTRKIIFESEV